MWVLTLLIVFTVTSAELIDKRGNVPVDADKMRVFTSQFRQSLLHIIANKWNETQPLINRFNIERSLCTSRLSDQESSCLTCAESECTPEEENLLEVLLEKAKEEIKRIGDDIIDWTGLKEIGDFFEGIGKTFLDWSGLKDMGDFFENLGKGVLRWDGWEDIGDSIEDLGKGIGKGIKKLGGHIEDTVKDLGKGLEGGIKDIGKGLKDGVKDIGKGLEDGVKGLGKGLADGVKDLGKGIKGIGNTIHRVFVPRMRFRIRFRRFGRFGKKKRSIDYLTETDDADANPRSDDAEYSLYRRYIEPEVRQCMEKCHVCGPSLQDDITARIRSVCGEEFVQLSESDTFRIVIPKLEDLYKHVINDTNPIVTSVEYDLTSWSMAELAFTRAHINVYFEDGYQTYQSSHPFKVAAIPTSAALMAKEYWDLFMKS